MLDPICQQRYNERFQIHHSLIKIIACISYLLFTLYCVFLMIFVGGFSSVSVRVWGWKASFSFIFIAWELRNPLRLTVIRGYTNKIDLINNWKWKLGSINWA